VTREVVMFATRRSQEPVNAEANRFLFELEQQFDLMRLKARREILEQEEMHLAEEQESLRNDLKLPVASSVGAWWRAVATRVAIWRLKLRREGLAEEARRLVLLEGDIEFALRLRRRGSRS
jgi:hypothetical protein